MKAIIDHALTWSCVRGVTFQPIEDVGRNENFDVRNNRLTLSEVRRRIIDDHGLFGEADMWARRLNRCAAMTMPSVPDCTSSESFFTSSPARPCGRSSVRSRW